MRATVNGQEYRLRFVHFNFSATSTVPKRKPRGYTACIVEQCMRDGEKREWVPLGKGETTCGNKDNYNKETGRQFALVRALQNTDVNSKVKASLVEDYLRSKRTQGRSLCLDLWNRGYENLFEPVFRPELAFMFEEQVRLVSSELKELAQGEVNSNDANLGEFQHD